MKKTVFYVTGLIAAAGLSGCIHTTSEVEIKPVEIKPIKISLDVQVKVDEALDKSAQPTGNAERDAISTRMRERRPQIQSWQEAEAIGINNRGKLENRLSEDDRSRKAVQILIDAENQDRDAMVRSIAASKGITAEEVESAWALRSGDRAESGTWLQDADGTWYQK